MHFHSEYNVVDLLCEDNRGELIIIEQGIEKGDFLARVDMILTLHKDGIGLSQLAKAAKFTEEQVLKILKDSGVA
jgi:DNA-binding phage protein